MSAAVIEMPRRKRVAADLETANLIARAFKLFSLDPASAESWVTVVRSVGCPAPSPETIEAARERLKVLLSIPPLKVTRRR